MIENTEPMKIFNSEKEHFFKKKMSMEFNFKGLSIDWPPVIIRYPKNLNFQVFFSMFENVFFGKVFLLGIK